MQQQKERDNSQSQLPPRTPTPLKGMGRPLWGEGAAETMGNNRVSFQYLGVLHLALGWPSLGGKQEHPAPRFLATWARGLLPGPLP